MPPREPGKRYPSDAPEQHFCEAPGCGKPLQRLNAATTARICLRCDRSFKSVGPGNRICQRCTVANEGAIPHRI